VQVALFDIDRIYRRVLRVTVRPEKSWFKRPNYFVPRRLRRVWRPRLLLTTLSYILFSVLYYSSWLGRLVLSLFFSPPGTLQHTFSYIHSGSWFSKSFFQGAWKLFASEVNILEKNVYFLLIISIADLRSNGKLPWLKTIFRNVEMKLFVLFKNSLIFSTQNSLIFDCEFVSFLSW